jgi:hypothetical protein
MSPVSEGIQFKENSPEKRLNERHKGTEGQGSFGEPGVICVFWRRLRGKGVLLENMISCALWGQPWEKTQVAYAITTVQIHFLAQS